MKVVSHIPELQNLLKEKRIGFIPTMGCLHEGHLSLIKRASQETDFCVVSIFVNPIQFNDANDFETYPKKIEQDIEILKNCNVDCLFHPSIQTLYPTGFSSSIKIQGITKILEGKSRPNHFDGVTTVVAKLFHIIQPCKAYFGKKDAQQIYVIQKMVKDFNFPVSIIACDTVREEDGLAMSSRNRHLSTKERNEAAKIYQCLCIAKNWIEKGERNAQSILDKMHHFFQQNSLFKLDYISINEIPSLKKSKNNLKGEVLISIAAYLGKTRLIDNITLSIPK